MFKYNYCYCFPKLHITDKKEVSVLDNSNDIILYYIYLIICVPVMRYHVLGTRRAESKGIYGI